MSCKADSTITSDEIKQKLLNSHAIGLDLIIIFMDSIIVGQSVRRCKCKCYMYFTTNIYFVRHFYRHRINFTIWTILDSPLYAAVPSFHHRQMCCSLVYKMVCTVHINFTYMQLAVWDPALVDSPLFL